MRPARIAPLACLLLAACQGGNDRTLQGYVEGTFVYVSAETAGRVVSRPVNAGETVKPGDLLFVLDDADQKAALAGAEARLAQARADYANLLTGQRDEEISVLAANLQSARTALQSAIDDYGRKLALEEKGVVAQSVVDDAKTRQDSAQAQADAAERQLLVAKLPARPEVIESAKRAVAAEEAAVEQAKVALDRRTIRASDGGLVEETFYEAGEMASGGQPVVSLLPDANRKVRFFVPEGQLAQVNPGDTVAIGCDGCASGLTAQVTFVATEAEYTPPIIYSKDSRDKLSFRVDAKPLGQAVKLKVGQPLDIKLPAAKP